MGLTATAVVLATEVEDAEAEMTMTRVRAASSCTTTVVEQHSLEDAPHAQHEATSVVSWKTEAFCDRRRS